MLVSPREIYQYGEHIYAYVCLHACVSVSARELEEECIICMAPLLSEAGKSETFRVSGETSKERLRRGQARVALELGKAGASEGMKRDSS